MGNLRRRSSGRREKLMERKNRGAVGSNPGHRTFLSLHRPGRGGSSSGILSEANPADEEASPSTSPYRKKGYYFNPVLARGKSGPGEPKKRDVLFYAQDVRSGVPLWPKKKTRSMSLNHPS